VLEAAERLFGSELLAQIWFHEEPINVFDYKAAEDLVASGRAAELMLYLQSLEAGQPDNLQVENGVKKRMVAILVRLRPEAVF